MYIKTQPFYDSRTQCYFSILTLNKKPTNPLLSNHVVRISNPRLSPFEGFSGCSKNESCIYVFKKSILENDEAYVSRDCLEYLTFNDYPFLIDLLLENGVQINTKITSMMQKNTTNVPQNILCFISN